MLKMKYDDDESVRSYYVVKLLSFKKQERMGWFSSSANDMIEEEENKCGQTEHVVTKLCLIIVNTKSCLERKRLFLCLLILE